MKKIFLILIIFTASCTIDWSYDGVFGPQHWGDLKEEYKFCKIGYNQSPIDLNFSAKESELSFFYNNSDIEKEYSKYSVNFIFHSKDFMKVKKKKYNLQKIYFNHPSEHSINSQHQILELNIVHKSDDEQLAILGIFIKIGKENAEFNKLIKLLEDNDKKAAAKFDLSKVIKVNDKVFFYDGSLSVPPCTEGVKRFLMKTEIDLSKEQIIKIINLSLNGRANNRPLQKFMPEKY